MNILQINKFYHIVGGVDRYFFEVSNLLEKKGNNIAYFSMYDKKNKNTKWSKYFVSQVSFKNINLNLNNGLNVISRMIYSTEAKKKLPHLLDDFTPNIAHIHNIYHQISPSIFSELNKRNIPIIHTVGDYHLISPHHNNLFHNGKICEVTKKHRYYNAIIHKCVKNSYLASFAEAIEQYFHYIFGFYRNTIDFYIAPSKFLLQKLEEYGISKDKIIFLPYFIDSTKFLPKYELGNYVLYFGRLSSEKGLGFLIDVMRCLPNIPLKIIGKGSESDLLNAKIKSFKLQNVEIISKFILDSDLKKYISNSRFTVFPSLSYEIFGISLLESYASGKPVLASKIGALPEIVKDGFNGFLFEPGNVEDCAEKINKLWNNPALCRKMGKNARNYVEKYFSPEEHYEKLMAIYKKAINKHI